jgi:hypothetical protein
MSRTVIGRKPPLNQNSLAGSNIYGQQLTAKLKSQTIPALLFEGQMGSRLRYFKDRPCR